MADFEDYVKALRIVLRELAGQQREVGGSKRSRDALLAQAWRSRPVGTTWRALLATVNEGMPSDCTISYGNARLIERNLRERADDEGAELQADDEGGGSAGA